MEILEIYKGIFAAVLVTAQELSVGDFLQCECPPDLGIFLAHVELYDWCAHSTTKKIKHFRFIKKVNENYKKSEFMSATKEHVSYDKDMLKYLVEKKYPISKGWGGAEYILAVKGENIFVPAFSQTGTKGWVIAKEEYERILPIVKKLKEDRIKKQEELNVIRKDKIEKVKIVIKLLKANPSLEKSYLEDTSIITKDEIENLPYKEQWRLLNCRVGALLQSSDPDYEWYKDYCETVRFNARNIDPVHKHEVKVALKLGDHIQVKNPNEEKFEYIQGGWHNEWEVIEKTFAK